MTDVTLFARICQLETSTLSDNRTLMFLFHEQKLLFRILTQVWGIENLENFGIEVINEYLI